MEIQQNISLAPLTTFKIGGPAEYFCAAATKEEIIEALEFAKNRDLPWFVLGGGSNMLISDNGIKGLVLAPNPRGIKKISEDDESVIVDVAAGENWDEFVQHIIGKEGWGIENMSYVPGNAGAFAVQNVGAYGQEASDVVIQVEAFDIQTGEMVTIKNADCGFYYRHSIFNTTEKGRFIILQTRIKLSKIPKPDLSYPDLQKKFSGQPTPSLQEIRTAIIEIRNRKFPFPAKAEGGNVGSFFQHPLIDPKLEEILERNIKNNFPPEIQQQFAEQKQKFQSRKTGLKITAFLIDICGLKGMSIGGAKINENQPLVILNKGTATSSDVLELARAVRKEVYDKTGIAVPIEPELVGFTEAEIHHYLNLNE